MYISLKDQIYEDILINIKEFSMLRYFLKDHLDVIDPKSKEDKDTIHSWPNQYAIDRFHRKNKDIYIEELEYYNIDILDSKYLFVYTPEEDPEVEEEDLADYERFVHLANYFNIERFVLWASKNMRVDITLYYKETFPNKFGQMLRISNTPLIDYLMRHPKRDELVWKVELRDNPSKYFYIDYTMTELVFKEMELYFDSPFDLRPKDVADLPEKLPTGYALHSDRDRYDEIVEKSYDNFKLMVEAPNLYLKVKEYYNKHLVR